MADAFDTEILDILSFMLTSARGLLDEPASYGPFRMADGVSRLCGVLSADGHPDAEFLNTLKNNIDERKFTVMSDMEDFKSLLDDSVLSMTQHLIQKQST